MLLHPSGNRLAARFNPKLVEWGIIPAVLTSPFVLLRDHALLVDLRRLG
jgi:hypothetical protein